LLAAREPRHGAAASADRGAGGETSALWLRCPEYNAGCRCSNVGALKNPRSRPPVDYVQRRPEVILFADLPFGLIGPTELRTAANEHGAAPARR
jgi:hypothetical protein